MSRLKRRHGQQTGSTFPRRGSGCAHYELGLEQGAPRHLDALELRKQGRDAESSEGAKVLTHRRERWKEVLGIGHVIETHDTHVFRHPDAPLVKGVHESESHTVVCREHRGEVDLDIPPERVARVRSPVARGRRSSRKAGTFEVRVPLALATTGIQLIERTREVKNVAVAEVDEVLRRERRACALIHRGREEVVFGLRLNDEGRDAARHFSKQING